MSPFKPEFVGKMNFYLSGIDDLLRHGTDKPTIGLILCKGKNQFFAEYALRGFAKPLGISDFEYVESLPDQWRGQLPAIQELEQELATLNPQEAVAPARGSSPKGKRTLARANSRSRVPARPRYIQPPARGSSG